MHINEERLAEMTSAAQSGTNSFESTIHIPVMLDAVVRWLQPRDGLRYLDATLGGGGHTEAMLAASAPTGQLIAIDADPAAYQRVASRLSQSILDGRLIIRTGNFREMGELAGSYAPFAGIVMDLGFSSDQLSDQSRGFSFNIDGPLDMRFDSTQGESAADILASRSEEEIADILWRYGEERRSRAIARRIVATREKGNPIVRSEQLASLIARVIPGRPGGIHPATRSFQALRIAVNAELESLEQALPQALDLLAPGGRLAVISFHSLEDRIVKHWIRAEARDCICPPKVPVCSCGHASRLHILTPHPEVADKAETDVNVRSRSAKLRVAAKIEIEGE
jgi:16S rRNA (cytosine1402-N4)-methyltransferase